VLSLSGTFRAAPGLRVRPAFEWDGCVVFDPHRRRLVELNLTSWLILELCDGRCYQDLRARFAVVVGERIREGEIDQHLRFGLVRLAAAGLMKRSLEQADERGRAER
jgi:hypothetical protein